MAFPRERNKHAKRNEMNEKYQLFRTSWETVRVQGKSYTGGDRMFWGWNERMEKCDKRTI